MRTNTAKHFFKLARIAAGASLLFGAAQIADAAACPYYGYGYSRGYHHDGHSYHRGHNDRHYGYSHHRKYDHSYDRRSRHRYSYGRHRDRDDDHGDGHEATRRGAHATTHEYDDARESASHSRSTEGVSYASGASETSGTAASEATDVDSGERSRGWRQLAAGAARSARSAFGAEASSHPREGLPKVGYALASAMTGDADTAIYAMRRAFRIDPEGAAYFHPDKQLAKRLRQLDGQYGQENHLNADDRAFMTSAIHLLLGEPEEARKALQHLSARPTRRESTAQLRAEIESRLGGKSRHASS